MTRLLFTFALLGASIAAADDGSVVVRQATGAVLVDDGELPKAGIGFWRLEPGSTVEAKDGFAELEIGEGAWLRLRAGGFVKLVSETESSIELELQRGGGVLDLLRQPEKDVAVKVGASTLRPDGKGSYLIEASPGRFAALKGKAEVRAGGVVIALKPKTAIAADGTGGPEKLAKIEDDAFEEWREEQNDAFIREERRANTFAERTIRPARN